MTLTPEQKAAAESGAQQTLVVAAAGSGKTSTIAARIAHMIQQGIYPSRIAAITYTNAASRELHHKIQQFYPVSPHILATGPKLPDPSATDCDGVQIGYIGTIHGYCLRLLQKHGDIIALPAQLSVMDEEQDAEFLEKVRSGIHYKGTKKDLISAIEQEKKMRLGKVDRLTPFSQSQLAAFSYFETMKIQGLLSFDAMLVFATALLMLGKSPEIGHLIVDEYQDCSDLLHSFVMAHPGSKFLAADPDQAIFSFAGGRVNHVNALARDRKWTKFFVTQNFRSTPEICRAAQSLIEHNTNRIPKTLVPARDCKDEMPYPVQIFTNMLASDVANMLTLIPPDHNEVAFLCRTNLQVEEYVAFLEAAGLPVKHRKFLPKIGDWNVVKRFVALCCNPENDELAQAFLRLTKGDKFTNALTLEAFSAGRSINQHRLKIPPDVEAKVIPAMLDAIKASGEAVEAVSAIVRKLLPGASVSDLAIALGNHELEHIEQGDGITVTTVHAAKGREFGTVFVMGLEDEVIPGLDPTPAELEEERRCLFVAMTRARKRLFLTSCTQRRLGAWMRRPVPCSPSRFLSEITV